MVSRPSSRWTDYGMLVVVMALWGGTWPVGRVVSASVSPWNAALLRFVLASVALVLVCLRTVGLEAFRVRSGLVWRLLFLGATGVFGYSFLFFSGLKTIGAGRAALIVSCIPVCIALCSSVISRRRLPGLAVAGIVLSLAGVAAVIANGNPVTLLKGGIQSGDLMILGCVACWTAYTLQARSTMKELAPLVTVTWSCMLGTLMILPFSLGAGLGHDLANAGGRTWLGLLYLGLPATSLGYYWYYRSIKRVGAVASGIFINLVPLFAVLFGCLFLDEDLSGAQIAGGLMVIAGVMLTAGGGSRNAGSQRLETLPSGDRKERET